MSTVAIDGENVPVTLITYKQFVDDSHPYKSLQGGADGSIEQIKAFNKYIIPVVLCLTVPVELS